MRREARLRTRFANSGKQVLLLAVMLGVVACGGSDAERVREASEDTAVADGSVSADIGVLELQEGDCIVSGIDAGTRVEAVTIVPCSDAWQHRVTAVFDVADADQYPGEVAVRGEAARKCGSDAYYLYPTTESWDLGDREIVCLEEPPAPSTTLPPAEPTTTVAATTTAAVTSTSAATPVDGPALPLSASEVYQLVAPSIVFVETETGTGSGFLVDGGYVVTNHHVVWPHDAVWVVFPDGTEAWVPVVGWDPFADLAVLGPVSVSAEPLILGDGEAMSPGSTVFLVGYPAETDLFPQVSITEGILSRFREWDLAGLTLFQTDAAIAGGQSGGALVNTHGEVIGISTWQFSEAGFSVATSAADAAPIVDWLIEEEAALWWNQSLREPGAGDFEFEIEMVNRWDNRVFTFVGEIGSTVDVLIDGTADGVFRISSPFGVHLLADDSYSGVEVGTVEILTYGVHYLDVWTLFDELPFDGPASYTVASSSRLQPFEDPDDGQHLVVGDIVAAVIDYFSDIDWYTIDLEEGETVLIWTDSIATDTEVYVDYPGATIDDIAHDDDSGSTLFGVSFNAEIVYTAPATGEYIVAVQGLGDMTGGSYFLGITPLEG